MAPLYHLMLALSIPTDQCKFWDHPRLEKRIREKRERNLALSQRALTVLEEFKTTADI